MADRTSPLPSPSPDPSRLLRLARRDKRAAENEVAALSLDEQVALVCSTPLEQRADVLDLTPIPEDVIPLLPEAELCFTAKALGLADAGWLLEQATPSQLVASIDLDGWQGLVPDHDSLGAWLSAFLDAGEQTLVRAAQSLDPELIVLMLRDRAHVILDPKEEGWQPPEGARTLEGQFHLLPKRADDTLEDLIRLLDALFREDYWLYFRTLQGVVWELGSDLEEWALRWRTGRLEDLGFPAWEEAMAIYGYLRPRERDRLEEDGEPLETTGWQLPVYLPDLPTVREAGQLVFRAASELEPEERRGFFYSFVSLSNKVAVADRMALGDAETLPGAIEKGAEVVSAALEHLSEKHGVAPVDVLRRMSLDRLFRVGVAVVGLAPPHPLDLDDDELDEDEIEPDALP